MAHLLGFRYFLLYIFTDMELTKYEMKKIFSLHMQFYVCLYNTGRISVLFFSSPRGPCVPLCFYPLKKTKTKSCRNSTWPWSKFIKHNEQTKICKIHYPEVITITLLNMCYVTSSFLNPLYHLILMTIYENRFSPPPPLSLLPL